jgi:N-acetylmuramoyl-L-alanine amidase
MAATLSRRPAIVLLGMLLLAGLSVTGPSAWALPGVVLLQPPYSKSPVSVTVWELDGTTYIPLHAAAEVMGGKAQWYAVTQKIILRGPRGRIGIIPLLAPRMVVEHNRFVLLPHRLQMARGKIWISIAAFQALWQDLAGMDMDYDPVAQTLLPHAPVPVMATKERGPRVSIPALPAVADRRSEQMSLPTPQPTPRMVVKTEAQPAEENAPPVAMPSPARPFLLVLDPGHGGKDPGAIGPTHLEEKEVVLDIARKLGFLLQRKGMQVVLTRSSDEFIPLPQRAEIANRLSADLFVSIHANASRDRKANGSQVFIYNRQASSRKAAETARMENLNANVLEIIKDDLRQTRYEKDSISAAGWTDQQLGQLGLDAKGIERAPFYVLAKSHMPSILVEVAFISNYHEERKLRDPYFRQRLAAGIYQGLMQYLGELRSGKGI